MEIEEIGKLFDRIVEYYPAFNGDGAKLKAWHDALINVTYETAKQNLIRYVSDPDNKYPPHPGAFARRLDAKTDAERYHDHMRQTGVLTLAQYDQLRKGIAPPSSDIMRRVREQLG